MAEYKRKWRELSDEHKEKLSKAATNKPKSATHRQHIRQGMIIKVRVRAKITKAKTMMLSDHV